MMKIKVWNFLAVLFALLLVASAVETATDKDDHERKFSAVVEESDQLADTKNDPISNPNHGGGGGGGGGGGCGQCCHHGQCHKCCAVGPNVYAVVKEQDQLDDTMNSAISNPNHGGGGGGGGGCGQCCQYGHCHKCCAVAPNVYVVMKEPGQHEDTKNGAHPSGGGGGH